MKLELGESEMKLQHFNSLKSGDKVHVYQHCLLREITVNEICLTGYASPLIKYGKNQIALYEDVYLLPRDADELIDHMESDASLLNSEIAKIRVMRFMNHDKSES